MRAAAFLAGLAGRAGEPRLLVMYVEQLFNLFIIAHHKELN